MNLNKRSGDSVVKCSQRQFLVCFFQSIKSVKNKPNKKTSIQDVAETEWCPPTPPSTPPPPAELMTNHNIPRCCLGYKNRQVLIWNQRLAIKKNHKKWKEPDSDAVADKNCRGGRAVGLLDPLSVPPMCRTLPKLSGVFFCQDQNRQLYYLWYTGTMF